MERNAFKMLLLILICMLQVRVVLAQTCDGPVYADTTIVKDENGDLVTYYSMRPAKMEKDHRQRPTHTIEAPSSSRELLIERSNEERNNELLRTMDPSVEYTGTIPYTETFTPTGGVSVNIPIPVAAGYEFAPQISLSYNSQSGYNVCGQGWSISGVPSFSIINKNPYYYGERKGADVNDFEAAYSLDGIPLVRNEYQNIQSNYPLKTAKGHIIVKRDTLNGITTGFTARYPDGSIATFEGSSTQAIAEFPIKTWTDYFGNKIVFDYFEDSGKKYLSSVTYGFREGENPGGRIDFQYEPDSHFTIQYFAGLECGCKYLLKNIISRELSSDEEVATIALTHQKYILESYLKRIDFFRGTSALQPILFSYSWNGIVISPEFDGGDGPDLGETIISGSKIIRVGKLSPSSYSDGLVIFPSRSNYTAIKSTSSGTYFGSGYNATDPLIISPAVSQSGSILRQVGDGFQYAATGDVDGDGVDEIVVVNFSETSPDYYLTDDRKTSLRIFTGRCSASGSFSGSTFNCAVRGYKRHISAYSPAQRMYYLEDFLGDGRKVLLSYTVAGATVGGLSLIDPASGEIIYDGLINFLINPTDFIYVMDMDGDGCTEICVFTEDGLDMYHVSSSGVSLYKSVGGLTSAMISGKTLICDLGGDGYPDFIEPATVESGTNDWKVWRYTGNSFAEGWLHMFRPENGDKYYAMDIDRDGKSDLLRLCTDGVLEINQNFEGTWGGVCLGTNITVGADAILIGQPVNLEKRPGQLVILDGRYVFAYDYVVDRSKQYPLASLQPSRDIMHEYSYENLAEQNVKTGTYNPSTESGFRCYRFPLQVLRCVRIKAGNHTLSSSDYSYFDPVVHSEGWGFCGFCQVHSHDSLTTVTRKQYFNPEKMGVPIKEIELLSGENIPYLRKEYTWNDHSTLYGKLNPQLTASFQLDSLSGIVTESEQSYDAFDNVTNMDTWKYAVGSVRSGHVGNPTLFLNSIYGNNYRIGVPMAKATIRYKDRPEDSIRTESYSYSYSVDGRLSRVLQKLDYGSSSPFPSGGTIVKDTKYSYDGHGNVILEETASYGATTYLERRFSYDTTGRYMLSSIDEHGMTTTYTGHNVFCKPAQTVDPIGHTTSDTYDVWGNLTSRRYWDNTTDSTMIAWGGSGTYTVTSRCSGKPETVIHYDALDREIRRATKRFDGSWLYQDRGYDETGRLSFVTKLYKTQVHHSEDVIYSYDSYGRLVRESEMDRLTTYAYDGRTTTVVKDGITTITTKDALGRILTISDAGGSVNYVWRNDNQPSYITAPGEVTTSFDYDRYGRRCRIVDPSAGEQTDSLVHYADGTSKLFHRNPNGQIETTYNKYGDPVLVNRLGEYSTTYSYDEHGCLSDKTSSNGTREWYYRDFNTHRLSGIMYQVPDSHELDVYYSYNNDGQVSSVYYSYYDGIDPDGITVEHTYANGHRVKSELVDGENRQTVFELTGENGQGLPQNVTTGTAHRYYTYDEFGYPIMRNPGGGLYTTYSFNPLTGNMESRQEWNLDTEEFTYDNMNRLASHSFINSADSTLTSAATFSYAANGNLTNKSNVGSMFYEDSAHPYRITSLTPENPGIAISEQEQNVTYTCYGHPALITEGEKSASFTYDSDGNRVKMCVSEGNHQLLTRYYIADCFELDIDSLGVEKKKIYIGGDYYSAPMVCVKIGAAYENQWTLYNIVRDPLGSIIRVSSASGAQAVGVYSFDPWGRMRDPYSMHPYDAGEDPDLFLGRGYGGHEHLPWFGLINMNARLYDPVVGRFLSPDPYVQDATSTQNFNRYSYCLNNPLKYSDESGECIHLVIGGLVGGFYNLYSKFDSLSNGTKGMLEALGYLVTGAIAGVLGAGVGLGISSAIAGGSFWAGFVGTGATAASSFISGSAIAAGSGFSSSFTNSFGNALIGGQKFTTAFGNAFANGLATGVIGGLLGGGFGGFSAVLDGRNFWHGGRLIKKIDIPFPQMTQEEILDCRYEVFKSLDKYYYNRDHTTSSLRESFPDVETNEINLGRMYGVHGMSIQDTKIDLNNKHINLLAEQSFELMSNGLPAIYEYNVIPGYGHAVLIRQVKIFDNRVIVRVMNPDSSGFLRIKNTNGFRHLYKVFHW